MITKMKKLTFLVYHKEYEEFLNSLRELGVVHIVEKLPAMKKVVHAAGAWLPISSSDRMEK